MEQGLAVRVGLEAMALRRKVSPQLPIVVDFPVCYEPQRAVFVRQRLMPTREIDDRKPPHSERQWTVEVGALVVGSAVDRPLGHATQRARRRARAVELEY